MFVNKHTLFGDYIYILCMKLWLLLAVLFSVMKVGYLSRGNMAIEEQTLAIEDIKVLNLDDSALRDLHPVTVCSAIKVGSVPFM